MILSKVIELLLGGMVTSIEIFLLTLLFSLPLGLVVAGGRMSNFAPLRWLMKIYISMGTNSRENFTRPYRDYRKSNASSSVSDISTK